MDDVGLLERARRGDEMAFSRLFATYHRPVFRYAAYMSGADSADDIVQDTFLAVLRQRGRRDSPTGSIVAYLIGIARHLVLKRRAPGSAWSGIDDLSGWESDEPSALDRMLLTESVAAIRAAVQSLPPAYREAVVLCELEALDYAAAAAIMQCPVGTVRSRLSRARALLATKLAVTRHPMAGERR